MNYELSMYVIGNQDVIINSDYKGLAGNDDKDDEQNSKRKQLGICVTSEIHTESLYLKTLPRREVR